MPDVALPSWRVLIVGGGIAGLAAARALRRVGIPCELVEREATWSTRSAGIYLPGNGMAALERLGLASTVAGLGQMVLRRRLSDDRGRPLIDFDEAGLWRDVAAPVALHRQDLHRVLVDGVDVSVRLGATVTTIEDGPEAAIARFDDGSSEAYDLVIGADGIESSLRTMVLGGPPAQLAGQVGWRFVIEGGPGIDGWNGWIGRDRGFLALGIGGDRVYAVADIRSRDGRDPTGGDLAAFRALFAGYPEPVPSLLAALASPADLWFSPFDEVVPPVWGSGRVVLIGDAAHATAPNMAEGASLAMEDALVLAEELATDRAMAASLAAFAARRTARIEFVQHMTRRRDRLRYLHPGVRRAVMGLAGHRLFRAHYRPLLDPP